MTSEQLRYAIELANYQTLQLAADALHISKSGLSRAIRQLESELGVKLFYRTSTGSFLTKQGQELLPLMRKELQLNFNLHQNASQLKKAPSGKIIRIGYASTLLNPLINTYLEFRKQNEAFVSLNLQQYSSDEIIRLINDQELDVGFIDTNAQIAKHISNLSFHPIHTGDLSLFVQENSPLTAIDQLTPDDIRAQRFVLLTDPFTEEAFNQLQNLCGPLEIELQTDNYEVAVQTAEELGSVFIACDVLLRNTIKDFDQHPLVRKSLQGLIKGKYTYGWLSNPQQPLDKLTRSFINKVSEGINDPN